MLNRSNRGLVLSQIYRKTSKATGHTEMVLSPFHHHRHIRPTVAALHHSTTSNSASNTAAATAAVVNDDSQNGQLAHGMLRYRRMPIEVESPEAMGMLESIQCNLCESSMADTVLGDVIDVSELRGLVLNYGDHHGLPELRREIVRGHEEHILDPSKHVLVTVGASHALFMISTSLLSAQSHIAVMFPNYTSNLETPEYAMQVSTKRIELKFEHGWRLQMDELRRLLMENPNVRLVSITTPHNPTGMVMTEDEIRAVLDLVREHSKRTGHDCRLLVDETYRDMQALGPNGELPPLAATFGNDVISVSSMSKTYGMPGIRIGWIVCRDERLMKRLLAAKEQTVICGSAVDEKLAYLALSKRAELLPSILSDIETRRNIVKEWVERNSDIVEWVEPRGGCVTFPRFKSDIDIDIQRFHFLLLHRYSTYVGAGHWFGYDERYMRIGYGWSKIQDLRDGLDNITKAAKAAMY